MRVLIVDDDEDVSLLCRLALERLGHHVASTTQGTEAVKLASEFEADLVLLDGMLPGTDGLAVLDELATHDATSSTPVVVVSARVGRGDQLEALTRGAADYLAKPFELPVLASIVDRVGALDAGGIEAHRRQLVARLQNEGTGRAPVAARREVGELSSDMLSRVLNLAFDAIVSVDEDQHIVGFNKGAEQTFGYLAEEVLGKPLDLLIPSELVDVHQSHARQFAEEGDTGRLMGRQRSVFGRRRDGTTFPAEASITKLEIEGTPVLTAILRDATERRKTETELRDRARQQAAVADLGLQAVTATDVHALLDEAVTMLQEVLEVDYAKILQLEPGGETLRMVAGAGWPVGVVGRANVPASPESQAGYTLHADEPTISVDLPNETRFNPTRLLLDHHIVSGMSVSLPSRTGPFGIVGVYTRSRREFTTDDIHFLQSVANVLASAVQREKDEKQLRAFLDAAPDATVVVDATGRIVSANAQAEFLFGYSRDELMRLNVDALVPDVRRSVHAAHRAGYMQDPRPRPMGAGVVLAARRKDGSDVPVDIMLRPVETDEGPMIVAAVRDTTERRRNEEVRDAFLHAVSHELRTPLTSVLGFAGLLEANFTEELPETGLDMVRRIAASARKLERLLGDLLDLDRLTRGVMDAQRRSTEVATSLERTVDALNLADRSIRVTVDPPDLLADVDPAQFERVVENLVVNASRHTPPGSSIDVSATRSTNGLLLAVDDRGPGVPDSRKASIFEPFRRGDDTMAPGTGIGLSLVARFAELHGGRAWVEDRPGGGSSFRVVLAD